MPLIEIDALPQPESVDLTALTRKLNAAVAEALGCRLDAVWTVWRTIDGPYTRGDRVGTAADGAAFGPIVHVFHNRTRAQVARVVEVIEQVLRESLNLAGDAVFVTTQPVEISDAMLD